MLELILSISGLKKTKFYNKGILDMEHLNNLKYSVMRVIDVVYSIILIFIAPMVGGIGIHYFRDGDLIVKISSLGLIALAIFIFGYACMGPLRVKKFSKRISDK